MDVYLAHTWILSTCPAPVCVSVYVCVCPFISLPHLVPPDQSVVSCSEMLSCLLQALLSSLCVSVCVGKIVCPTLGSAPTDNKAEMSADTEPQSD